MLLHYLLFPKTASQKIGALICSIKFLSSEVAFYLYKVTMQPCMEYYCHDWDGAPSCCLELLDKLQKWIYRTVGLSLAASLQHLAHQWNVTSLNPYSPNVTVFRGYRNVTLGEYGLSPFYRHYFGRCSSELAELVPLPYSWGRPTRYSDRFHDFSVTITRCYKDAYVNSFLPCTTIL